MDFLFGIFGIFIGGNENWSWFANPLLILAWGLVKHSKASLVLSVSTTAGTMTHLKLDSYISYS